MQRQLKPLVDKSVEYFTADGTQLVFAITPFGASETRQDRLDRLQEMGRFDPNCSYCSELFNHPTLSPFMPSHTASVRCRSGRHNHCTCDTCF